MVSNTQKINRRILLIVVGFLLMGSVADKLFGQNNAQQPEWFIVGGVQNYAYALINHLQENNVPCKVFVPQRQKKEALYYFGKSDLVTLTFGCPVADKHYLLAHAKGAKYLFFDVEFATFRTWKKHIEKSMHNCIEAAEQTGATLFYPGRIYPFGTSQSTITQATPYAPTSDQGRAMHRMEEALQRASARKRCRVHVVRTSFLYGPNVIDNLTSTSFYDIPDDGTFTWLFRTDLPYQFVSSIDVAALVHRLTQEEHERWYTVTPFAGHTYDSVESFGRQICNCSNKPYTPYIVGPWKLSLVCLAAPNARRGKDIAYSFEQSILIDDTTTYKKLPDFAPLPPRTSLTTTLAWFQSHRTAKKENLV